MPKIDLKNLPKAVRIAIAVVPTLLVGGLFFYFLVLPKNTEIEGLKKAIAEQQTKISKSQSMADKLDELKVKNEALKVELKKLEEQLPEENEISALLKQVSDEGIKAGLNIMSWKPSKRRNHSSGVVYEVPVNVNLTGSYHSLGIFFSSLTKIDRIINISNIKLGGPKAKGNVAELNVSFSAVTFTAVKLEDQGKDKDKKKKKKRRKRR